MSDIGNKDVFAKNLSYYVDKSGKKRGEICEELGIAYSTFSEWMNARKYPRIDKIELLANYFGIKKSKLIESVSHGDQKETPSAERERWERFMEQYADMSPEEQKRIDTVLDAFFPDETTNQTGIIKETTVGAELDRRITDDEAEETA